jgi:hypothetical protein
VVVDYRDEPRSSSPKCSEGRKAYHAALRQQSRSAP